MLTYIKKILRIKNNNFDDEVETLIASAKADLKSVGILESKINPTEGSDDDVLIKTAVSFYCRANFGLNNEEYERYTKAYETLRTHLALDKDYTVGTED